MTFGKTIKELRQNHAMTQERLAELLNISPQAVSRWETGAAMPDISLIPPLANLFGVTTDYLLEQTDLRTAAAPERTVSDDDIKFALFGGHGEITDAMYEEVKRFAAFIRDREAEKKKE